MIDVSDGVPGVNAPQPSRYREFWPFYLSHHLHPGTQTLHGGGIVVAIAVGLVAIVVRSPLMWLTALVVVPVLGSHLVFEHNRPVLMGGNPLWSLGAALELTAKLVTGRLGRESAAVRAGLRLD